jgi:hypothetical protein
MYRLAPQAITPASAADTNQAEMNAPLFAFQFACGGRLTET